MDEIKSNDYPVDAEMDVDKEDMKHLIKKGDLKNFPAVSREKQKKSAMSSAIPEVSGEETIFKT